MKLIIFVLLEILFLFLHPKKLDLKVILDFIPNHTSKKHQWFSESENNPHDEDFRDFYVWRDAANIDEDGNIPNGQTPQEPNNWVSSSFTGIQG